MERLWILVLDSRNPVVGYNITCGGEGVTGMRHTLETRRKIAEANRHRVWDETSRQNMSIIVSARITAKDKQAMSGRAIKRLRTSGGRFAKD